MAYRCKLTLMLAFRWREVRMLSAKTLLGKYPCALRRCLHSMLTGQRSNRPCCVGLRAAELASTPLLARRRTQENGKSYEKRESG